MIVSNPRFSGESGAPSSGVQAVRRNRSGAGQCLTRTCSLRQPVDDSIGRRHATSSSCLTQLANRLSGLGSCRRPKEMQESCEEGKKGLSEDRWWREGDVGDDQHVLSGAAPEQAKGRSVLPILATRRQRAKRRGYPALPAVGVWLLAAGMKVALRWFLG